MINDIKQSGSKIKTNNELVRLFHTQDNKETIQM